MFVLGDAFLVDAYVVYDIENPRTFNAQASFKNREEDIKIIFDKAAGAISLLMLQLMVYASSSRIGTEYFSDIAMPIESTTFWRL